MVLLGFGFGHWEILIVLAVMLLLFGHRLPSVMRNLGRSVHEFKGGLEETPNTEHIDEDDKK